MINTVLDEYKREEAAFYADLAHIVEGVNDEEVEHFMDLAESEDFEESFLEEDKDAADVEEFIERMDEIEDESDLEVERILEATEPLTYEQMIGLDPIEEE